MRILILLAGFLVCHWASAQWTSTGLPISIAAGTVVSGQELSSSGSLTNEGELTLSGEVAVASYAGDGRIELSGTDQGLNLGAETDLTHLTISGGGTKSIFSIINIIDSLEFLNGQVEVVGNNLVIGNVAALSGASASNYVIGKLIREGTGDHLFPIGGDSIYTPVTLLNVSGTDPAVGLQLINADPVGDIGFGIVQLSQERYWFITEDGGTFDGAEVEIPVINETIVGDLGDAVVAGAPITGNTYQSLGQSASAGTTGNGSITSAQTMGAGKVALGRFFDEQLRENDSTALLNIFNSTAGADWLDNTGWETANLDGWTGLTLDQKRVTAVDLGANNLVGIFPPISVGLEQATSIDISDNELTEVEAPTSLASLANLDVSGNRLQFATLEALLTGSYTTSYLNQKTLLERERVLRQVGENYTVDRTLTGSANSYSWFDGEDPIAQTGPSFVLNNLQFEDEGNFFAEVTNTNVPGLILTTRQLILRVSSLERDSA